MKTNFNFDFNLSLVLGHTLLLETKAFWSPNGIVDDARAEDPSTKPSGVSTAETLQAYIRYLPQLMQTLLPQVTPTAQANLAAAQATAPGMSQLQADMYKNLAPQLNATSEAIDASNKMSGAKADLAVLQGPGGEAARTVQGLDRENNPEFYKTRTATSNSIDQLMSGNLTGAEEEAINRRLSQDNFARGLMGTPTATSTVSNAMKFGDAARAKQVQGTQLATSFLPVSRSPIDATQVALGRPSGSAGQSQFLGVNQNAGAGAMDQGTNLLNQISGFQQTQMNLDSQKRDYIDRVNGAIGSING